MEKLIPHLGALTEEATVFVQNLKPRAKSATLVTLSGELGAGKTAFTKAAASALGIADSITSPTFVLEKIYALPVGSAFARLIHIDAYRLEGGESLAPLGFEDLMKDPGNLVMLEWPEKVKSGLPRASVSISITTLPDGSRKLVYG